MDKRYERYGDAHIFLRCMQSAGKLLMPYTVKGDNSTKNVQALCYTERKKERVKGCRYRQLLSQSEKLPE